MKIITIAVLLCITLFSLAQPSPTSQPTAGSLFPSTVAPSANPTYVFPSSAPSRIQASISPSLSPTAQETTNIPSFPPTVPPSISLPTSSPTSISTIAPSIIMTNPPSPPPTLTPTAIAVIHTNENNDRLTGSDIAGLSAVCIFVVIVISCICAGKRRNDVVEFAEDNDLEQPTTDSQPLNIPGNYELNYRRPQPYRD